MLFACESYANSIIVGNLGSKIRGEVISTFSYPWSFSFLNNDHLLVATKPGKIWLMDSSGSKIEVGGCEFLIVRANEILAVINSK